MSKNIHPKAFVRLLNEAAQPVYVLDDELTIVFLNQQCAVWLGPKTDQLIGAKCAYHVPVDNSSPEMLAAGLCPPPETLSGQEIQATISYYGADGRISQRRAWFHPLGSPPGDLIGIVAVVETEDLSGDVADECSISVEKSQSACLHEAICRFRREASGRFRADRLAGLSPAMQLARRQVELAAGSRSSVLLVGPPGSGRQHLAAAIHYAGRVDFTATSPAGGLIPMDCSVLAPDVILSTVAAIARSNPAGEQTKQTSLLLNHVDEIPGELQTSLAIFFSKKPFPLRLISTARLALTELCSRGQFSRDLASILSTIAIVLPPLNQRREDLPLLAQAFLEQCNSKQNKQISGFAPEAMDQLYAYSWPGNLDELMEMVSAAHQHAPSHEIGADDLPERLRLAAQAAAYPRRHEEKIVLDEFLGRVERELIRRALARSKGNKAKAARLLGLTRPRLYRRMVQLGMEAKTKNDESTGQSSE
jgi:DNA-binding NtrC family response regulator